mgnify:CR=1 FL=1
MKTDSKEIHGRKYTASQVPGRKGKRLFERVVRAIAPAVSQAAGAVTSERENGSAKYAVAAAAAVPTLLKDLPREELEAIEDALFEYVQVDIPDPRKPDEMMRVEIKKAYDDIFTGDPLTPFQVLAFAVEVNWGERFFGEGGLDAAVAKMVSLFKSATRSPTTGISGDSSSAPAESPPSAK